MNILKAIVLLLVVACNTNSTVKNTDTEPTTTQQKTAEARELGGDFKKYWYAGTAEITSYKLQQARYGELRDGTAVMIFVTEPMDTQDQVKADNDNKTNIPVFKLNATRNFNTGIYPYTMMSSTFLPLNVKANATKIAASIQEWCGHTYMQFNNRDGVYDIALHSYFQSEGDTKTSLPVVITENQLPLQLRLDPAAMPTGNFNMIPSAEFLRLKHIKTAAVAAKATLSQTETSYIYKVELPELDRTITYTTSKSFPYTIESWSDRYKDGADFMETKATKIKTIQTAYWSKNSNTDAALRKELGL